MQLTRGRGSLWVACSHGIRDKMRSRRRRSGQSLPLLVEASDAAHARERRHVASVRSMLLGIRQDVFGAGLFRVHSCAI
jgi:hypothetical protein